ncbi:MAG: cation:proton antiporter [Nitrospiraceae bacterium]
MEDLHQLETVILLLVAVLALTTIARRILIPYPILLVIGGLGLAVTPGLPVIHLDPDLVFLVFLPPILWAAAYFTSLRDFKANARPIALLAIGLVLATTAAVAATAIGRRLHIPHRVVTILEGESLVNDATALVLYRTAVAVVVSGTFAMSETLAQFVITAVIGVAVGLLIGATARWTLHLTHDSFTEIAITLLAPYAAWVLTEQFHGSGVLACVAGGLYLRRHFSEVVAPATRLQARAVWDLVVFVLNGFIFILIGLQLGMLRDAVPVGEFESLMWKGTLVSAIVIVVRLVWVPVVAYLPRRLSASLRARDPMPPWPNIFVTAWIGMRGIVSLAAALALPHATSAGAPFPFRSEIILITFMVILSTLVLQGLSLAPLLRILKLERDETLEREEAHAREHAATSALERLNELAQEPWPFAEHVDRLRVHYARRVQRFAAAKAGEKDDECTEEAAAALRRLRQEAFTAERLAVIGLRDEGVISDDVLHRIEHELDVEALRLGTGEQRTYSAQASSAG